MALLDNKKGLDASQPPAPSGSGMLSPLKHKVFATIWFANLASAFGGVIQSVGASWLMTSLDPSPTMVALVQASAVAPMMILSVVGGALADIYDRRMIMLITQIFLAIASAILAVIAFLGPMSPWTLLTFTFLIGVGAALYTPSWQASIPDQVPRSDVAGAVSLNAFAFNISRSLAPAVGGAIIAIAGAFAAFAINAVSYLGMIWALAKWRPEIPKSDLPHESLHHAIGAGLRYVSLSPAINSVLIRSVLFGFGAAGIWALMPLIAHDLLKGGPMIYGIVFGAFGAGAMGGALMTARLRARFRSDVIVNYSVAAFA
ncbi:MAG: MFS transporter, partial [Caulobacterales bacterium]